MQNIEALNWVDILLLILIIRSLYIGARVGLTGEFFKLIGTLISLIIGFHYCKHIAKILITYISMPAPFAQFTILFLIIVIIRFSFKYGVVLLLKVLNVQFIVQLERIGGAIVGLFRCFLLGGLLLTAILFFPVPYLDKSINEKSLMGRYFIKAAYKTYSSVISIIPSQEPVDLLIQYKVKKINS